MAIEGLKAPEVRNVTDEVDVAVEALDMLGLVEDRDRVTESIKADFDALSVLSVGGGERYVQLPRNVITLPEMINALDSGSYSEGREYPKTYVWEDLWTPGASTAGYKDDDLGNLSADRKDADWPAHVRMVILNEEDSPEEPLLHFLNQPFDEKYAEKGQKTQLESFDEARQDFLEAQDPGFDMTPLNVSAVAMIALMRRIKGEDMPMEWGFMRDVTLPRVSLGGVSFVGRVDSRGGQLRFGRSDGSAHPHAGGGLSVGPAELESQAS